MSVTASAAPILLTFTGAGINGTSATGSFTVDDGSLVPGYFATGGIYSTFSVSLSGIPGSGPSSVVFSQIDVSSSWFFVDPGGTARIAPYGQHVFGPPDFDHYDLGQPNQLPNYVYETVLTYNGSYRDTITWSAAVPASTSSVPAPGAARLLGLGLLGLAWTRRKATA